MESTREIEYRKGGKERGARWVTQLTEAAQLDGLLGHVRRVETESGHGETKIESAKAAAAAAAHKENFSGNFIIYFRSFFSMAAWKWVLRKMCAHYIFHLHCVICTATRWRRRSGGREQIDWSGLPPSLLASEFLSLPRLIHGDPFPVQGAGGSGVGA